MVDLSKEIDFSEEIKKDPELERYILEASKEISAVADLDAIQRPELDLDLKNHVIVYGLPKADGSKIPALSKVVNKFFNKYGVDEAGGRLAMTIGTNEDGSCNQIAYCKYNTPEQAEACITHLDNLAYTQTNKFECFSVKKVQEIYANADNYVEPKLLKRNELEAYNTDKQFRDQYIFREGSSLYMNWFDFMQKQPITGLPKPVEIPKVRRTEFSPKGRYLIGFFDDGFRLYGGSKLEEINFFRHNGVLNVRFSPDEKYIVSFNGTVYAPDKENYIVWKVDEAIKLRSFKAENNQESDSFKFSFDSKYIAGAFKEKHFLTVFELPSMQMLADPETKTKTPITFNNIQKFEWHTTKNLLICLAFAPVKEKQASSTSSTRITVFDALTRKEMKWKAWAHDAGHGSIVVADNGEWAAVVLGKLSKKKVVSTVVQIANFKKRDLQIDMIEINEKVIDFTFDTRNHRFGVVMKDEAQKESITVRNNFNLYQIEDDGKTQSIKQIGRIENKPMTKVLFAPNGSFFMLTNIDPNSPAKGSYAFGYLQRDQTKNRTTFELIKDDLKHAYMTYCDYDPSGKYVILGSAESKSIQIWSSTGELLFRDSVLMSLFDVKWRPRSINFLDVQGEKKLVDDWKNIKKKYEEADDKIINAIKYEREAQKKRVREEFEAYLKKKREFYRGFLGEREKILGFNEDSSRTAVYEVQERVDVVSKQ